MPSDVYLHRPGFLYSAITLFDFMNLSIQTANVTFFRYMGYPAIRVTIFRDIL